MLKWKKVEEKLLQHFIELIRKKLYTTHKKLQQYIKK